MNLLTATERNSNLTTLSKKIVNVFGDTYVSGAIAMCQRVHGFFYAPHFMVGGVLGYLRVCRVQNTVRQPDTSPTAQSLATSDGGLKPTVLESFMLDHSYTKKTNIPTSNVRLKSLFILLDTNKQTIANSLCYEEVKSLADKINGSVIKFQKMETVQ